MSKLKSVLLLLISSFFVLFAMAQDKAGSITKSEEPTDFMRSNGKIFVVVAVIVIILCGLFLYLYNLDKKVTALEKRSQT